MKSWLIFFLLGLSTLFSSGQYVQPVSKIDTVILFPDTGFKQVSSSKANNSDSDTRYLNSKELIMPDNKGSDKLLIIKRKNSPVFIEKKTKTLETKATINASDAFYRFMAETESQTKVSDPENCFRITAIDTDHLGITHIKSVQQYQGIDIYGSESVLHIDSDKERFTGSFHSIPSSVSVIPQIDENTALDIVNRNLNQFTTVRELTQNEKELINYKPQDPELIIYKEQGKKYVLAWEIIIKPNFMQEWKYFINALTGEILHKFNNTKYDGATTGVGLDLNNMSRTFNVYLRDGIYYLYDIAEKMYNPANNEGIIITLDANNTSTNNLDYTYVTSVDNSWSDPAAISAHCNAIKTYRYFDTTFNWNSLNGKGGNIISIVNVVEDDGSSLENAFWNGQAIFYGNGGKQFKSFAGALDVTAHEMSHGLITASANLEYYGQSGSINEAFADIFACMVDRTDWTIGEDITKAGYSPSNVIRDLSNPHNMGDTSDLYWQPAHTSEMYLGNSDNEGVHINSGIINYAFYLFALDVGKSNAEQVFFRALTKYLTKTSSFVDLRIAVTQSARDLFGDGSLEEYYAGSSFETVGIYEEDKVDYSVDFEINPGEELLFSYDTNPDDPISLYLSTARGTNYRQITNTPMRGKVSVTDDGSTAVFVSSEKRLRMINTTADINERIISSSASYDHVAISKDGKRLAATKVYTDASIYVIDLEKGEGIQYILYNPTTSNANNDAGGVLKAFSIEFDVTGEYLIYDAYNVINSNSLKDIYYWDIGFIKVWENDSMRFGDGKITKLFGYLPANVNVSNPVFSKNSPNIIAFDYFFDDGIIEEYGVYAANVETGQVSRISLNDRLGYPSFSNHDDKMAFSSINGMNMQVIKSIDLAEDKITPMGEAGVLVPDAKWPVYFTLGNRPLGTPPVSNFTADYKYGKYPLSVRFIDLSGNNPVSWSWTFEGGIPSTSTEQNPRVIFENPGFYEVTLVTSNAYGSNTLTKSRYIHPYDPVDMAGIKDNDILFYPNPASQTINITCNGNFSTTIYNMQGNKMVASENENEMNISDLKPGLYIFELKLNNKSYKRKLLKQ